MINKWKYYEKSILNQLLIKNTKIMVKSTKITEISLKIQIDAKITLLLTKRLVGL